MASTNTRATKPLQRRRLVNQSIAAFTARYQSAIKFEKDLENKLAEATKLSAKAAKKAYIKDLNAKQAIFKARDPKKYKTYKGILAWKKIQNAQSLKKGWLWQLKASVTAAKSTVAWYKKQYGAMWRKYRYGKRRMGSADSDLKENYDNAQKRQAHLQKRIAKVIKFSGDQVKSNALNKWNSRQAKYHSTSFKGKIKNNQAYFKKVIERLQKESPR